MCMCLYRGACVDGCTYAPLDVHKYPRAYIEVHQSEKNAICQVEVWAGNITVRMDASRGARVLSGVRRACDRTSSRWVNCHIPFIFDTKLILSRVLSAWKCPFYIYIFYYKALWNRLYDFSWWIWSFFVVWLFETSHNFTDLITVPQTSGNYENQHKNPT